MNQYLKFNVFLSLLVFAFQFVYSQSNIAVNNDSSEYVVIKNIIYIGNEKTKDHIISRELIFHINDSLSRKVYNAAAIRSRENLLNTFLFNFIEISEVTDLNNRTVVTIKMEERWYLWPIPIFELVDRNFNEWWQTRDFRRTNFGINLTQNNFRGRNETVQLLTRFGFDQNFGLVYTIPYLNRKQNDGLRFAFNYFRTKETAVNITGNKLQFLSLDEDYVIKQLYSGVRFSHRFKYNSSLSMALEYQQTEVNDSVVKFNNEYLNTNTDLQQLLKLTFIYWLDTRDSKSYPLKGNEFRISAVKQGFGTLKNEPNNAYAFLTFKHYEKLSDRFNISGSVSARISDGNKTAFINTGALGYRNFFVRGYELYVVNGQSFSLFKTNLKFALLKPKVYYAKWLPLKKFNKVPFAFYANVYSDFAYVQEKYFAEENPLANEWHSGYGAGVDFVTYYDLVTRFEYSFNKFGEKAFFIHFRAPI